MSQVLFVFSPSFFAVRTRLLHHSVGLSPTSSMISICSHLSRISSNLPLSGRDILLCFCTAPFASGSMCNFTLTPLNSPKPENTSLYYLNRSTLTCQVSPMTSSGVLMVRSRWYSTRPIHSAAPRLNSAVSPWTLTTYTGSAISFSPRVSVMVNFPSMGSTGPLPSPQYCSSWLLHRFAVRDSLPEAFHSAFQ